MVPMQVSNSDLLVTSSPATGIRSRQRMLTLVEAADTKAAQPSRQELPLRSSGAPEFDRRRWSKDLFGCRPTPMRSQDTQNRQRAGEEHKEEGRETRGSENSACFQGKVQ